MPIHYSGIWAIESEVPGKTNSRKVSLFFPFLALLDIAPASHDRHTNIYKKINGRKEIFFPFLLYASLSALVSHVDLS